MVREVVLDLVEVLCAVACTRGAVHVAPGVVGTRAAEAAHGVVCGWWVKSNLESNFEV